MVTYPSQRDIRDVFWFMQMQRVCEPVCALLQVDVMVAPVERGSEGGTYSFTIFHDFVIHPNFIFFTILGWTRHYILQAFVMTSKIEERGQVFWVSLGTSYAETVSFESLSGTDSAGIRRELGNYGSAIPLRRKHCIAINCVDYEDGSFPLDYAK